MYSFEDIKDELISADQDSYQVPEEIEEELPLRIRTIQYEDMIAQQNTQHLNFELKKYLDGPGATHKAQNRPYDYHYTESAFNNISQMLQGASVDSDPRQLVERPGTKQETGYRSTLHAELATTQNHYD